MKSPGSCIERMERMEGLTGADALGWIPPLSSNGSVARESSSEADRRRSLWMHFHPDSTGGEAFRHAFADLCPRLDRLKSRSLMAISACPREGRSLAAANLAIAFAQSGRSTLLLDADLRSPRQHQHFGLPRSPGLADLLVDTVDFEGARHGLRDLILGGLGLRHVESRPGLEFLDVLTAGSETRSAAMLLGSESMGGWMRVLQSRYDLVVVDTPPFLTSADAAILAPSVDAAVWIAAPDSPADLLQRLRRRLTGIGCPVVGILVNAPQVPLRRQGHRDVPERTPLSRPPAEWNDLMGLTQ